jgi:hypothetical protein
MPNQDTETRVHLTLGGHRIEYRPTPEVAAFLERITKMVQDPAVTEDDLVDLGYSIENPMLESAPYPSSRGWVTGAAFADPAYRVMVDLISRKRIRQRRIHVERIPSRYTRTVRQAARGLGVDDGASERAIADRKLATWIREGDERLDREASASGDRRR